MTIETKILTAILALIVLILAIWLIKMIYNDWKYYEQERRERKVIIRESNKRIKDAKKKTTRNRSRGIRSSNKKRV